MDEIARDLPGDGGAGRARPGRGKGPEELLAFERGVAAEGMMGAGGEAERPRARPGGEAAGHRGAPDGDRAPHDPDPRGAGAADAEASDAVLPADAAAALAAEAETLEVEEELPDAGLPPVPELTDAAAVARIAFVLMLTQREGLSLLRLAQACNTTQKLVEAGLQHLQQDLARLELPVEIARIGDSCKLLSSAAAFPYLQRLRGVKKLEKLSPAALETLAVIAYRQPVMRSEIEAIRGVKAGPMLRMLLHHKLVRVTGRADVPGRPLQYGTTQQFLDHFGLSSLQELPSIKEFKQLG